MLLYLCVVGCLMLMMFIYRYMKSQGGGSSSGGGLSSLMGLASKFM